MKATVTLKGDNDAAHKEACESVLESVKGLFPSVTSKLHYKYAFNSDVANLILSIAD